jgi:hypothetical protein
VKFLLETDANVLVIQLNGAASDLPRLLLMRWIAWIRLFDFDVKHVSGKKYIAANGLSRRPRTILEMEEEDSEEEDIEDFVDAQLFSLRITPIHIESPSLLTREVPSHLSIITQAQPEPIPCLEGFYSVRH